MSIKLETLPTLTWYGQHGDLSFCKGNKTYNLTIHHVPENRLKKIITQEEWQEVADLIAQILREKNLMRDGNLATPYVRIAEPGVSDVKHTTTHRTTADKYERIVEILLGSYKIEKENTSLSKQRQDILPPKVKNKKTSKAVENLLSGKNNLFSKLKTLEHQKSQAEYPDDEGKVNSSIRRKKGFSSSSYCSESSDCSEDNEFEYDILEELEKMNAEYLDNEGKVDRFKNRRKEIGAHSRTDSYSSENDELKYEISEKPQKMNGELLDSEEKVHRLIRRKEISAYSHSVSYSEVSDDSEAVECDSSVLEEKIKIIKEKDLKIISLTSELEKIKEKIPKNNESNHLAKDDLLMERRRQIQKLQVDLLEALAQRNKFARKININEDQKNLEIEALQLKIQKLESNQKKYEMIANQVASIQHEVLLLEKQSNNVSLPEKGISDLLNAPMNISEGASLFDQLNDSIDTVGTSLLDQFNDSMDHSAGTNLSDQPSVSPDPSDGTNSLSDTSDNSDEEDLLNDQESPFEQLKIKLFNIRQQLQERENIFSRELKEKEKQIEEQIVEIEELIKQIIELKKNLQEPLSMNEYINRTQDIYVDNENLNLNNKNLISMNTQLQNKLQREKEKKKNFEQQIRDYEFNFSQNSQEILEKDKMLKNLEEKLKSFKLEKDSNMLKLTSLEDHMKSNEIKRDKIEHYIHEIDDLHKEIKKLEEDKNDYTTAYNQLSSLYKKGQQDRLVLEKKIEELENQK